MQETAVPANPYRVLKLTDGGIEQLMLDNATWFVGQEVVSTGFHFAPPKGTRGTVVRLIEPYTNGCTSDVIVVDFGGDRGTMHLKPGEVRPSGS